MDMQTAFDKAYLGVMQQGGASMAQIERGGGLRCAYRDGKGRKCAAGHLIPDELYGREKEGMAFDMLCGAEPKIRDLFDSWDVIRFVQKLQRCHDNAAAHFGDRDTVFTGEFALTAGFLAKSHGLKIPKLNATG